MISGKKLAETAALSSDASPASQTETAPRRKNARRALIAGSLLLLGAGAGVFVAARAWQETALREAYLPDLESRVRREPYNGRLLALTGARQAEAHRYAEAEENFSNAVAAGQNDASTWLAWAASAAANGDTGKAVAILRLALRNLHGAAPIQEAITRCQQLSPNSDAVTVAAAIYPQGPHRYAAALAPGSFLNGVSTWWGRNHSGSSGFATRQDWAGQQANNAQAQRLWAEALLRNGRAMDAETAAEKAVQLAPDSLQARKTLGDALLAQGAPAKASLEYIACLKRNPNWLPALYSLGNIALDKGWLPIAIDTFERAVKQDPNNADAWIGLGRAYYNQKLKFGESEEAFRKAMKLAPARTDFYPDFANVLRANYRWDESESLLRKRIAAAPDDSRTHYLLGLLLLDHNRTPERGEEAEKELRETLRLTPNVAAAEIRLGSLLTRGSQPAEAIPLLEDVLKQDPYNVSATMALARAYRLSGQPQKADAAAKRMAQISQYVDRVTFLQDSLRRQPNNVALHLALARQFQSGGEPDKAKMHLDAAYMLQHHGAQAERGLQALNSALYSHRPAEEEPPK